MSRFKLLLAGLFIAASIFVFQNLTATTPNSPNCVNAALPECVDEGQTCVIGGTPCCGTFTCKGKFPNTTCQ